MVGQHRYTFRVVRLGACRGELTEKDFTIGVDSEELVLLAASELGAFTLENFPPSVTVELLATAPDGHLVFVTRPTYDLSYEAFRVFYGTDAAMIERTADVQRGSRTYTTFGGDPVDLTVDAGYTAAEQARALTTGLTFECR